MITKNTLKEIFIYKEGKLFWLKPPIRKSQLQGCRAGTLHHTGYWQIRFLRKTWREHRLVWMFHYGSWPNVIDHINRDKLDNRIENLRSVTWKGNAMNRNVQKGKRTPVGVTKTTSGKYQARLRQEYLGCFDSPEDAHLARKRAEASM